MKNKKKTVKKITKFGIIPPPEQEEPIKKPIKPVKRTTGKLAKVKKIKKNKT